jgi:hypothetical protein
MGLFSAMRRNRDSIVLVIVIATSIWFASWLMFHTFGYDPATNHIQIDQKLWSDFGAAIPLIRSFSMGNNWPPEYPGFPGEPIRYHFGFYFLAGMLEKAGMRIDWALNIPSIVGFAALMIGIYLLGRHTMKSHLTGILAVIFFLFDGTLAFIKYFTFHPISRGSIAEIYANHRFPVFGPWDGGPITAFWTLNIYTNQRHLAASYALVLGLILVIIRRRPIVGKYNGLVVGLLIAAFMSSLLVVNMAGALIALVFCIWFFLVVPTARLPLIFAGILSFPWFLYVRTITTPFTDVRFEPGYLIAAPLTVSKFLDFWWNNLGLHTILIPLGMMIAPKRIKILFIIPILILFIGPNILKLSPDMINNHKFFNFFLISGSIFSGYAIVSIFRLVTRIRWTILRTPLYALPIVLTLILTLSGIIDFFAVYNREPGGLRDIEANPTAKWIASHTPHDAVFLNSVWFYHPANIAGRYIFSGYPYFTWSYGYDKETRESIVKSIYNAPTKQAACRYLRANRITHVELTDRHDEYFVTNWDLWHKDFHTAYRNADSGESVYDVASNCTAT